MSAAPARQTLRIASHRQVAMEVARQRLALGILLFIGLAAAITFRLVNLSLFDGPPRHHGLGMIAGQQRADIIDRNGVSLASSFRAFALAARPYDIVGNRDELADKLAEIIPERPHERIRAALDGPGKFHFVARRILPEQAEEIRKLGEPGLTIERETERLYPNVGMAAHLIGYTGIDGTGEAGIERAFEERLTDPDKIDIPLQLAMDARVQQALESELANQMKLSAASGAAGIVMDVHTGEVVAMASLPAFNSNRPTGIVGMKSHMNRATLGVYELGSVLKPLTVAMGLEAGTITNLATKFPTTPLRVGRFRISDSHPRPHPLTIPEVLIYSSNVGSARIAEDMGRETQEMFLKKLGFMDKAPGELLEMGRTLTPAPDNWRTSSVMTIGFGHGIAITPLHLANAYATLVNGGIHRPATFLKVPEGRERPGERVFSEQTSHLVNGMLRLIVTTGTGRQAEAPGYRPGGKTGTAEKVREDSRGYDRRRNITTFAGAFPMDNPQYVLVTMIDDPTVGSRMAGTVAGPVFKNVVNRIAPILGIAPDIEKEPDLSAFEGLYTPRKRPGQ